MSKILQRANIRHYTEWLSGYLSQNRNPTHYYDYPFSRWKFFIATRDFRTGGECGADSVQIIIPRGVRHISGDIGHNSIFFMDNFSFLGRVVPIFSDPEFNKFDLADFRAIEEENRRSFISEINKREAEVMKRYADSDVPHRF